MSSWVQVLATFDCRTSDPSDAFGKECVVRLPDRDLFEDDDEFYKAMDDALDGYRKELEKYRESPESYLPMGSEGTLEMVECRKPWHDAGERFVTVYGGLRDRDSGNFQDIKEWFDRSCGRCDVHDAICWMSDGTNSKVLQFHEFE